MDLFIRSLNEHDDIKQIFELCKKNNLNTPYYTTNINSWNFQYKNNPLHKSWNSVLINSKNNNIHGHIGLSPQLIRAFNKDWTVGLINNGVISTASRNKLISFNNKKTFAITPLIDNCVNQSYSDGVDLTIANTTIHPIIWKTLKFSTINIERKTTIHTNIVGLFKQYLILFNKLNKIRLLKILVTPYIIFLILIHYLSKLLVFPPFFKNIEIKRITSFHSEFVIFFNDFYNKNHKIITCKRDLNFLNWKFNNDHFKIYEFRVKSKLVGFVILEKSIESLNNLYNVTDCIVLNDYLKYTNSFFQQIKIIENTPINFIHFLSCEYSYLLFNQTLKNGFLFTTNPLRILGFDKKKRHITSTLYFKINSASEFKNLFSTNQHNWFITPILFNPGYCV